MVRPDPSSQIHHLSLESRDRGSPVQGLAGLHIELYRFPYEMSGNHSQRAYRHLRQKLLDGSVPPGSRLSYGSIGREIGVSATPVREAVGQLASEGFVELVPQLGAVVRTLTREEAIELSRPSPSAEPRSGPTNALLQSSRGIWGNRRPSSPRCAGLAKKRPRNRSPRSSKLSISPST